MSWEEFYPYQKMMIYGLLLGLRGFHKGNHKDVIWVFEGGMERWIEAAGLNLDPIMLMEMTPERVEKAIRTLRRYDG